MNKCYLALVQLLHYKDDPCYVHFQEKGCRDRSHGFARAKPKLFINNTTLHTEARKFQYGILCVGNFNMEYKEVQKQDINI